MCIRDRNGSKGSDLTIACQTAPEPGVVIKGAGIRITGGAHNIIMRHCRIRNIDPGFPESEASRAIGVIGTSRPVHDMIFDHVSLSWATDENFTVYVGKQAEFASRNFTLSNSIIAEGDADSSHPESGQLPGRYVHSMGPSCNSNSDTHRIEGCSILSNLIAHNARRNPLMVASEGEVQNNVIYNWHEIGTHGWPLTNELDMVVKGNMFKSGPTTRLNQPVLRISGDRSVVRYVRENNWLNLPNEAGWRKIEDYWQGIPSVDPSYAETLHLECVGASKPSRDNIDQRIVSEYLTGTGQVGIGADHNRDFSNYWPSSRDPAYDGDKDGMADSWEIVNGLNPLDPNDYAGDMNGDGYRNIENFINEIAVCAHRSDQTAVR